jgi:rifampin ADP-ribosylating transferase
VEVLGEVTGWTGHHPDVLQQMRDHVAQLAREGVEAIDD